MSASSNVCTAIHTTRSMSPNTPHPTFYPHHAHPSTRCGTVTMRPLVVGSSGPSTPTVITSPVINGKVVGSKSPSQSAATPSPLALFTAAAKSVITANTIVRCVRSKTDFRTNAAANGTKTTAIVRRASHDRSDKVRSEVVLGTDPVIGTLVHNSKTVSRNSAPVQSTFIQCSGHEDAFDCSSVSTGTILKKVTSTEDNEVVAYEQLMKDPFMVPFVPKFYRTVQRGTANDGGQGCDTFIELEDLLYKFASKCQSLGDGSNYSLTPNENNGPFVMDIKMGTRTFLESEVTNGKLRSDLYDKMFKINPNEASDEERSNGAVTKLRYMTFRESMSSSSNLGFRIEGVQPELKLMIGKEYQLLKEEEEIAKVLNYFIKSNETLRTKVVDKLKQLRENFIKSDFFKRHEVIGSSLLVIHDGSDNIDVWMIDFAKTVSGPMDATLDHLSPWTLGNHEDGYLFGLNNLIRIISEGGGK